ncbi:MAG: TRAP transporter TatT component family protein [Elusimicrobiota bacterium]
MNKIFIAVAMFAVLSTVPALPVRAEQKIADELSEADRLFLYRTDHAKALAALSRYREYYKEHPDDPEGAWRVSMACYYAGYEIYKSNSDKKILYAEGRDAGQVSLKINPESAPACFWTAVNMALYGQTAGVIKMLFTLGTVRGLLEKSSRIDPAYAYGGAFRILGKIDQELPGILGGSNERAKEYYEKAINVAPDEPMNYLFISELFQKAFADKKSALEAAEKGLSLPLPDITRHESRWGMGELKKIVSKLK